MKTLLRTSAVCGLVFASIAAHANVWQFAINATGSQVVPASGTGATGPGTMTYNDATNMFQLNMTISGLSATTASQITATQLYSGAVGSNGALIDDLSVLCNWNGTNGTFSLFAPVMYNLNQSFEAALLSGNAYLLVRTSNFQNGEIRGQFTPVPEPGTIIAIASGLAAWRFRRRK